MIDLAKIDNSLSAMEHKFLLAVAQQIGVTQLQFENLIKNPAPHIHLQPETERILQFHRLVLLMNVDQKIEKEEEEYLYQIGLKLGLPAQAIRKTLTVMHQYENKMVPPNVLLEIFKTHYN